MQDAYLRKLMDWAARAPISEIEVQDGDFRIHLVKQRAGAAPAAVATEPAADNEGVTVVTPLPGIFYVKSAPDAPPFIAVGQTVHVGDTVGLVEAMKMFNPIISEHDGVVEAVLVESGQEVAADQPILRLRPARVSRA